MDREREKDMEVKAGLGKEKRGLIADFDPSTPSVSEHSPPQALHFNTTDIRTAKFTWVKNRERCLDKMCPLSKGVAVRLFQVNESNNSLCPCVFTCLEILCGSHNHWHGEIAVINH